MKIRTLTTFAATAGVAALLAACSPGMSSMSPMGMGDRAPPSPLAPMGMTARPDADMQAVLDALSALGAKPFEMLTVRQARSQPTPADAVNRVKVMRGLPTAPDPSVTTVDLTYPTGAGTQPVRVYKPANASGRDLPVVVYFHGGGWVLADLNVYDATPRSMAKSLNAIVVSVEYRKGPENKFPAFHEDANNAYRWVLDNARSWGGDPETIAVSGESAGGNLALNVAIAARDGGLTQPKAILAVYPIADANPQLPSKLENMASLPLRTPTLAWFGQHALRGPADMSDPRYNLVAANLRGLAPVTIVNAQIDPLRSDGETLMAALRAAGVSVDRRVYDGAVHEFFSMADVVADARDAQTWSFGRLRSALR